MAEFFRRDKGFPFIDFITASHAMKLYEDAQADLHAQLSGAPEDLDGFCYYAGWHESCGGLVRVRVRPVARGEVPASVLARLLADHS